MKQETRNKEILRLYRAGDHSLAELGAEYGMSRERIRQIIKRQDPMIDGTQLAGQRTTKRAAKRVDDNRKTVQRLAREGKTAREIREEVPLTMLGIKRALSSDDPLELQRRASARARAQRPRKTKEELLEVLRRFIAEEENPTISKFASWARFHNEVGPQTYMQRFGSWSKAVVAAGGSKRAKRSGPPRRTNADLYEGLMRVARILGRFPSTFEYQRLRREEDGSHTLVRERLCSGDWPSLGRKVNRDLKKEQHELSS